jgi:hypothetical protein
MQNNQIQCLPIGGQPVAVAKLQAAKPLVVNDNPVITFGRMECRQLGDNRMIQVGRIGGIEPVKK